MSDLLNQASLVMVPSGYKEDTVYSVVPSDGSGDLTFTRASNGTRVNSAGLVEVCPWNLVTYSEELNNAIWNTYGSSSITANDATAPNGTTTADRINSSTNIFSGIYQSMGTLPTNVYTYSIYVKAGTNTYFYMLGQGSSSQYAFFNLSTGVVGNTSNIDSASIESVGNGWFRCQIQKTGNAVEMFIGSSNIQNFTPTASGTVYLWGAQVNIGSTAKPYFPTTDRLNVPRLTYQNGGGGCPSLLLEKQSTNLLSYSEDFSNGYWELGSVATITTNTVVSPDGTQNADTLTANGTGSLFVRRNVYLGTAQTCSNSLFVKKANNRYVGFRNSGTVSNHDVFDFDTKTWTNNSGATLSYDEFPNGWFRLKSTNTDAVNLNYYWSVIPAVNTSGVESTTASNLSVYIWGGQAEQNASYATSYIPTTSSSATRVADSCYKTGISSLFGTNQGTFFIDLLYLNSETPDYLFDVTDSSNTNRFLMFAANNTGLYLIYDSVSGGFTTYQLTNGQRYKIAVKYNSTATYWYINGVLVATGGYGFAYQMSQIYIGQRYSISNQSQIQVNETIVFPTALSGTELISLTTI